MHTDNDYLPYWEEEPIDWTPIDDEPETDIDLDCDLPF